MLGRTVGIAVAAFATCAIGLGVTVHADVKTQERTQIKLEGMLGRMMSMFGGKAAREGVVNTVALKGNRMLSLNDNDGELIDLDEEKVYQLNVRKKEYTVVTFAELRQRMEEARQKAEASVQQAREREASADQQKPEREMEIEFSVKQTGQSRQIAGFDTSETVATIIAHEKGRTLEEAGGLVMTSSLWMAPSIPGLKEIADFRMRYAQKLYGPEMVQSAQEMVQAIAMYPAMKDAMARFQSEAGKMSGVAVLTETTFESVASADQQAQQQSQADAAQNDDTARGVGGLVGGLGRRMMRRKNEDKAAAGTPGRATIMTTTTQYLEVSSTVGAADVAVPTGYKQKS